MISRIAAGSLHLWKGVSRTPLFARAVTFSTSEKANTIERMHSPTGEKLDRIIREEKEKGVPITPSVLRC
uniref:Uncharacterized protein n=1 Tax=Brassica campestris TaxID=3711 RepID=M4DEQ2_BRACM